MQRLIFLLGMLMSFTLAKAQNSFKAIVKSADDKTTIQNVIVKPEKDSLIYKTDSLGYVEINNLPDGLQKITFSISGFKERTIALNFPLAIVKTTEIFLEADAEEIEEVIISSTRTSRTIENIPTRTEAISGEELEEKGNMKPGDIRMMLNESTGIQTQQTSATSYNSSIRIQGLDGKYTQILKDGFPLYSGYSGGLGLLQITPLDLKQVEIIKGASSTLYGAGAIAGLVNLISKTPKEERELNFLLNATSAAGLDLSGFYGQKFKKFGITIFASFNLANPYDPADIGLTAIPKYRRFTLNPKFFVYFNDKTTLNIGFNSTIENRVGGNINSIKNNLENLNSYIEENNTDRFSTQFELVHQIDSGSKLTFKNALGYYNRSIKIPDFDFAGLELSSYNEMVYQSKKPLSEWIAGLNLWTNKFNQDKNNNTRPVNYNHITYSVFGQNNWNPSEKIAVETGLRIDYQNLYKFFVLPRIAVLLKFNDKLSMRFGGGLGYKPPTVFTEDAERLQFKNVLPIDVANAKAEKSIGSNLDFNFKTPLNNQLFLSVNTLFFYTRINDPLVLTQANNDNLTFNQPGGFIDTKGIETNIKFTLNAFKLFVGYTFADVNEHFNNTVTSLPLVAKHRLNNVLMYEKEENLKLGLEAYYFSKQQLNDGAKGKPYWICGFMAEKIWPKFSLFINFENFLDTRQTRFDTIFTGPVNNPVFRDIYAPVDGFVVNGGLKIKI